MTQRNSEIRVVVADDSQVFRRTLCAYLAAIPGFRVVGAAADADEAVAVTASTQPDVVLLDLVMPRGGGASAAFRIKNANRNTRVILLSLLGQRELAHATQTTGADGYVCKADIDAELIGALAPGQRDS